MTRTVPKLRVVKLGAGTLAALQHVCPVCAAALGVHCTTPNGEVRLYVHSKRMDLARDANSIRPAA